MADDSNIVHRWEINNARATLATGRAMSEEFHEGGFRWIAGVEKSDKLPDHEANFTLRCDVDHNGPWNCKVEVTARLLNSSFPLCTKSPFFFNATRNIWKHESHLYWRALRDVESWHLLNGKLVVEFHILVISSERGRPIAIPEQHQFTASNRMSNVILKIEDKMLHVSKEYLAVHSPVFATMFFGDYAEKGKEEVEIKDVIYEEFLDVLHLIYLKSSKITDRTVHHILKLADRFQMEDVLTLSEEYLTKSSGLNVAKKLLLADRYRLTSLRDHCLQSFSSVPDLTGKLNSSPEFETI